MFDLKVAQAAIAFASIAFSIVGAAVKQSVSFVVWGIVRIVEALFVRIVGQRAMSAVIRSAACVR